MGLLCRCGLPFGAFFVTSLCTELGRRQALVEDRGSGGASLTATKLKVELFYESLCPYCRRFIITALAEVMNNTELSARIDLHLYPYGNAQTIPESEVSAGYHYWHPELGHDGVENVFSCQHEADECFGNLIEACFMEHVKESDPALAFPFVRCMEERVETNSMEMCSYNCAEELGFDLAGVKNCTAGGQGNQLMTSIGNYTRASGQTYVPWVVIDGHHSAESELDGDEEYSGHFLKQLCDRFEAPVPSACLNVNVKEPAPPPPHAGGPPKGLLRASGQTPGQAGGGQRAPHATPRGSRAARLLPGVGAVH